MNEKKFSDVMKEDDTDYIDETISNSHKATAIKQNKIHALIAVWSLYRQQ